MTTPNGLEPPGSAPWGGTWGAAQDKTEEDWKEEQTTGWEGSFNLTKVFGSFIQNLPELVVVSMLHMLAELLDMVPFVGDSLSDLVHGIADGMNQANATANTAKATATTAESQLTTLKANTPLWTGIDPAADTSLNYSSATQTFAVTQGQARGAFLRLKGGDEKRVIEWLGYGNTDISEAYLDLYEQDPTTGDLTLFHQSSNLAPVLLGAAGWHQYTFPQSAQGFLSQKGDIIMVRFRVVGSGTHHIYGKTLAVASPLSGIIPSRLGAVHNGTSSATSTATILHSNVGYTDDIPFFELTTDHGQDDVPVEWIDTFERPNRGDLGGNWALRSTVRSLAIYNQSAIYDGTTDGYQAGLYLYPLTTDRPYLEINISVVNGGNGETTGFLCSNNVMTNFCGMQITNSEARIVTGAWNGQTVRGSIAHSLDAGDNFGLEYVPETNTYRLFKNGNPAPLVSWTDSGNIINHGWGNRFVGMTLRRRPFAHPHDVGRFHAKDVVPPAE